MNGTRIAIGSHHEFSVVDLQLDEGTVDLVVGNDFRFNEVDDQDVALVVEVVIEHDEKACRLLKHTGIGGERVNLRKFHQVGQLTCEGVDGDQCRRFCVGVDSVWSLDAEECFALMKHSNSLNPMFEGI